MVFHRSLPNGRKNLFDNACTVSEVYRNELLIGRWIVEGASPFTEVYCNGKCLEYLYTLECKYNYKLDTAIISKVPAGEYSYLNRVEQIGSGSGYFFEYFSTLEEAVLHSILKPERIEFRNIPSEELEQITNTKELERE